MEGQSLKDKKNISLKIYVQYLQYLSNLSQAFPV